MTRRLRYARAARGPSCAHHSLAHSQDSLGPIRLVEVRWLHRPAFVMSEKKTVQMHAGKRVGEHVVAIVYNRQRENPSRRAGPTNSKQRESGRVRLLAAGYLLLLDDLLDDLRLLDQERAQNPTRWVRNTIETRGHASAPLLHAVTAS